jgi:hypothetical protein
MTIHDIEKPETDRGVLQLDDSSSRQRLQNSDVKERRNWVNYWSQIDE